MKELDQQIKDGKIRTQDVEEECKMINVVRKLPRIIINRIRICIVKITKTTEIRIKTGIKMAHLLPKTNITITEEIKMQQTIINEVKELVVEKQKKSR